MVYEVLFVAFTFIGINTSSVSTSNISILEILVDMYIRTVCYISLSSPAKFIFLTGASQNGIAITVLEI